MTQAHIAIEKPDFSNPTKQCDLVMKGGITSGVVYPAAVLKLAPTYRFRSIGGTSAGAIAAALTAAAEYGREKGGFDKLDALRKEIGSPGFLLRIFDVVGPTRPLMRTLIAILHKGESAPGKTSYILRALFWPLVYFAIWAILGMIIGAVVALLITWHLQPGPLIAGAIIGAYLLVVARILRLLFVVMPRDSGFGLCSGFIPNNDAVLTNWLHKQISDLAGVSPDTPLTFADLQSKTPDVQLKMVTSNLSHGRPYVFPRGQNDRGVRFIFNEDQLRNLFPSPVVGALKQWGEDYAKNHQDAPKIPSGFYYLADDDDLPILLATRMSLSFPVLLSAIPLYTIDLATLAAQKGPKTLDICSGLQKNWFSDGGISSNFPIHFFDAFLPSRPTFAINLMYSKAKAPKSKQMPVTFSGNEHEAGAPAIKTLPDVVLPKPGFSRYARPWWESITDLPTFLARILDTARNHRDNMQMALPSYRERAVQIWLNPDEGGMNLTMMPETIQAIDKKGTEAGDQLLGMDFQQHQWIRLRVLTTALETELRRLEDHFGSIERFQEILQRQLKAREDPEKRHYCSEDEAWCTNAQNLLKHLVELIEGWKDARSGDIGFFTKDAPKPPSVLRVTPPI